MSCGIGKMDLIQKFHAMKIISLKMIWENFLKLQLIKMGMDLPGTMNQAL